MMPGAMPLIRVRGESLDAIELMKPLIADFEELYASSKPPLYAETLDMRMIEDFGLRR